MLVIGSPSSVLEKWRIGTNGKYIELSELSELSKYDPSTPVTIKGTTLNSYNSLIIEQCVREKRDYYFIDTGYFGNHVRGKTHVRVVFNGFHHSKYVEVPDDRYKDVIHVIEERYAREKRIWGNHFEYDFFADAWRGGDNILVVVPGRKNQYVPEFDIDKWVSQTVDVLKKHTDRKIIIREKKIRKIRIGDKHIYGQFIRDKIFAVVTANSLSAVEAVGFGVPCFTSNQHSVRDLCSEDFSKIETPYYPDRDKVLKYFHWLAYCQYTKSELKDGTAYSIIKQHHLC